MSYDEMFDRQLEAMPSEERQRFSDRRLAAIVDHAYRHAPAVKELLDRTGIAPSEIRSVRDLERLPLIDKGSLPKMQAERPPFGGFLAVPIERLKRIYVSPGPIYDPEPAEEDYAKMAKIYYAAGFRKGDVILNTWMYHLVPAGLLSDGAAIKLGAVVVPTGVGNTDLQVRIAHDLGAIGFLGTPSFLAALINKTEELGHDFRDYLQIRKALVGAEMLPPSLARKFAERYGIQCTETYGTADVGSIAYQCSSQQGLHIVEEVIVEIVDPETGRQLGPGEEGEVVVTSLKEAYPLLRLRTGDLSAHLEEPCPCGRTSYRLKGILGRIGAAVKIRGMFVHPGQVEAAMQGLSEVAEYQVVVSRSNERDNVQLRLAVRGESTVDHDALSSRILSQFREACRVTCDQIRFCAPGELSPNEKRLIDIRTWD